MNTIAASPVSPKERRMNLSLRDIGGFLKPPLWRGLLLFLVAFFVSCSPVRYMGIETCHPAGITFPREVKSVLIVNNTVPQPEVPFTTTVTNPRRDSMHLSADSAVFDFCRTLGMAIADAPAFEDVRLLEKGYRTDKYFFKDRMLTTDDVSLLCDEHAVDAVISVDRMMFQMKEELLKASEYGYGFERKFAVEAAGILRVYLPDRDKPLASILVSDTVYPQIGFDLFDFASVLVYPEIMLRETAQLVAERSRVHFVPYWSDDIRWYYVSSNAQWKEAAAYAGLDRWEQAYEKWKTVYERTKESSWRSKSRLASNLALSKELTGDFEQALYWASESYRVIPDKLKPDDRYATLQQLYIDVLKHRILVAERLKDSN